MRSGRLVQVAAGVVGVGLMATGCSSSDPAAPPDAADSGSAFVSTDGPRPVIVDTDMGADDLVALAFLLEHPDVDVRAITVAGTGLARCEAGVANALSLLERLGAAQIPVSCGSETPVGRATPFPDEDRAHADRFYGLAPTVGERGADDRPAPLLIADTVRDADRAVTVLTLGPLTNLAHAFDQSPDLADDIRFLFSVIGTGTDGAAADPNLMADLDAARSVLGAGLIVTILPSDLVASLPSPASLAATFDTAESAGGRLVSDLLEAGSASSLGLRDTLAAAVVVDETTAVFEITDLAMAADGSLGPGPGAVRTRIASSVDPERFDQTYLEFYGSSADGVVTSPVANEAAAEGRVVWRFDLEGASVTGGGAKSRAMIDDGVVYFVGFDNTLYAVSIATGDAVWSRPLEGSGPALVEIAVSDDAVFYRDLIEGDGNTPAEIQASSRSLIAAADRSTGEELWSIEAGGGLEGPVRTPAYADGIVYYGTVETGLFGVDAATGEQIWNIDAPFGGNGGAAAVVDGVVYMGASDGSVHALDATTGDLRWRVRTQGSNIGVASTPAVVDGVVYFGSDSGEFLAVEVETGETIWETVIAPVQGLPSSPVVADGRVFFGSMAPIGSDEFGGLWAFDAETGQELWRFGEPGGFVLSSPTHHGGSVHFVSKGRLYAVDAVTGQEQWRLEFGGQSDDSPVVHDGVVYFQATNAYYAVSPPA